MTTTTKFSEAAAEQLHNAHVLSYLENICQNSTDIVSKYKGRHNITENGNFVYLDATIREYGSEPPINDIEIALAYEMEKQGLQVSESQKRSAWVHGTTPETPASTMYEKTFTDISAPHGKIPAKDIAKSQMFTQTYIVRLSFSKAHTTLDAVVEGYHTMIESLNKDSALKNTPEQGL